MDQMDSNDLANLLAETTDPCVSIYMPTHRIWNEKRHDPIQLKNLRGEAKKQLMARGLKGAEADGFLKPVRRLEEDQSFWRTQSDGLALFLSTNGLTYYRLPMDLDHLVVVTNRFHVKPLLHLAAGERRFYVLSLNIENIRFLTGTQHKLTEEALDGVPLRLSEYLSLDSFERQRQLHSGAAGSAVFHGHGNAADDASTKKRIVEFFRQVDNAVRNALSESRAPLVLAGQDHLRGLYRLANHYEYLTSESVDVNPDDLSQEELHKRAWEIIEPTYRQARTEAAAEVERLLRKEPEHVSNRLTTVVPAAYFRRVRTLFVRDDAHVWGRFDRESHEVEIHDEPAPGDQDLLDFAVAQTLQYAGTVYLEETGAMPGNGRVAAIFRY